MGKRQKAKEMAEAKTTGKAARQTTRKATGKAAGKAARETTRKAAGKAARQTYGPPMHIRTYLVPTWCLHRTYMVPMPTLHGAYMGAGFGVKGDFSYHCMENTGHGQIIPIV